MWICSSLAFCLNYILFFQEEKASGAPDSSEKQQFPWLGLFLRALVFLRLLLESWPWGKNRKPVCQSHKWVADTEQELQMKPSCMWPSCLSKQWFRRVKSGRLWSVPAWHGHGRSQTHHNRIWSSGPHQWRLLHIIISLRFFCLAPAVLFLHTRAVWRAGLEGLLNRSMWRFDQWVALFFLPLPYYITLHTCLNLWTWRTFVIGFLWLSSRVTEHNSLQSNHHIFSKQ